MMMQLPSDLSKRLTAKRAAQRTQRVALGMAWQLKPTYGTTANTADSVTAHGWMTAGGTGGYYQENGHSADNCHDLALSISNYYS